MTDVELIKNHTIFFAYFCHLIETNQADAIEELCQIGGRLDEEINRRKISELQIIECIIKAKLDPQDQLMISKYIYPDSNYYMSKVGNS